VIDAETWTILVDGGAKTPCNSAHSSDHSIILNQSAFLGHFKLQYKILVTFLHRCFLVIMIEHDVDSSHGLLQSDGKVRLYTTKSTKFSTLWTLTVSLAVVSTCLCLLLFAYILSMKTETSRAEELSK
jgi:hypothetical protein